MRKSVIMLVAAAALLRAQTPPGTLPPHTPLTLAEAEAMAVRNHPQIAEALNNAAAVGQRIAEARSAYYPTVNGEVTGTQGYDLGRIGAGALAASRLFNRFGAGVEIDQLITDFGRTHNLVANSSLQAQAANQTATATRYDVIMSVDRAYFEVLQNQAFVTVAQDTVKARQTLADQVSALYKAQLKSEVDLSFAQVNVSEAQLLLIRAQDSVRQAYADLARALGLDQPAEYQLSESPAAPALPAEAEPLVVQAIQNRPELSALRLQYEAAQKFEAAERDLSRPDITGIAVGGAMPYINSAGLPSEYEGVGVNLQIPIFNGHLFSARTEQAHQEALASNQRLRNEQQQVEHDVYNAWVAASTAYQRIPVTVDMIKQAQLAIKLAQGRYNLGLASIVEVTQAQLNLTQAQIENVTAKYDYQTAYAALQYTIGALR
jgi:outer membrane protein